MKITVEPNESETIESLDDLATLVSRAQAMVAASGGEGDEQPTSARVRLSSTARVKSIEVTW